VRLSRGTVVTASIGSPSGKPRPFLVLRSNHFAAHSLVTIVAFTSTLADAASLRVTVQPSAENGLHAPSQAMIDHIQSIRAERRRSVGLAMPISWRSRAPSRSIWASPILGRDSGARCADGWVLGA
jgi:mRNA interferase MazF